MDEADVKGRRLPFDIFVLHECGHTLGGLEDDIRYKEYGDEGDDDADHGDHVSKEIFRMEICPAWFI